MLEFAYIALIVLQIIITPVLMIINAPAYVFWLLLSIQIMAGVIQNIKFPCIQFRVLFLSMTILTLTAMYTRNIF